MGILSAIILGMSIGECCRKTKRRILLHNNKIIDKCYGSIPHLSTSKLTQQADKKISMGQELMLTHKVRHKHDLVIVTEKLDGSNVGVIKQEGKIIPLVRTGYEAMSSQFRQHHMFAAWVFENQDLFDKMLKEGYRICGEWCAQAHGTIYDVTGEELFSAFDIINPKNHRIHYSDFDSTCDEFGIEKVPQLHIGSPISIEDAITLLGKGHYGKPESPEGVVYRYQTENSVEFMAKWVRADKEDGKYLTGEPIWNKGVIF